MFCSSISVYQVSPWALIWDNENYYLVAYDAADDMIKHFHVDKMLKISITAEKRLGQTLFKQFNTPKYTNSLFGMNTGEEVTVTLEVDNDWVGVLIDRFGKVIIPVRGKRQSGHKEIAYPE